MSEWKHKIWTLKLHHQFLLVTACHLLSFDPHNHPILTLQLLKCWLCSTQYVTQTSTLNFTAEGVIILICALNSTTDIIILTSQCCLISDYLFSLLLFNVSASNSVCYRYTKLAFHLPIKSLSLNDFWGFALKKILFKVSVLPIWVTTLLVFHALCTFAAEYIKKNMPLTYILFAVCSVHHSAKYHQFPLQW